MIKKKNSMNINGFAMAELLAVSVVILLIFSVLISNYLPLVAEYENRVNYSNVTAKYAAFYVRKVFNDALENDNDKSDKSLTDSLNKSLNSNGFVSVYNSTSNSADDSDGNVGEIGGIKLLNNNGYKETLQDIIRKYDIEEIIISKYVTDNLKSKYKRNNGSLFKYISYLPTYISTNTPDFEKYRIVLKTKDYGYATSQILPDPPTPIKCFDYNYDNTNHGFIITKYRYDRDSCKNGNWKNVIITPNSFSVKINGQDYNDKVIAIGDKAFEVTAGNENKIESIRLNDNITKIGKSAFAGNRITEFNISDYSSLKEIGENAFKGNQLNSIEVPIGKIKYGDGVFSNNSTLNKIELSDDSDDDTSSTTEVVIPKNMFELNEFREINENEEKISIFIPSSVTSIGEGAFKNLDFKEIEFEDNSKLTTIGNYAFSSSTENNLDITIPTSVTAIGEGAFQNLILKNLTFKNSSIELTIGANAFNVGDRLERISVGGRNLDLILSGRTGYVTIKASAFNGQKFTSVIFSDKGVEVLQNAFAGNNFDKFTFPSNIKVTDSIFGDNYPRELSSEIEDTSLWCSALYGTRSCSCIEDTNVLEGSTFDDDEEEIDNSGITQGSDTGDMVYICSFQGKPLKYVTYTGN